ncbi:DUF4340 domain-containing protein [Fimbriiglobus ruber]|uniref:DUF4340 domain-containing protein n=1 Tax=Fimbriiglobus ruber TaxID=1908690 RepID=A0A225E6P5_9BACT|nr:DUF4340 domain-containing protein [Fimbriiglobus ruber]OWK44335.1 hypothetical protein FRUB_02267 [Fimbriiglobus ruber]
MNFRPTVILFVLAAAIVLALVVSAIFDGGKDVKTDGLVAPLTHAGVKDTEIDTVELVRSEPSEERLTFVKVGNKKWELREPVSAKVDSVAVERIISQLYQAKPIKYNELSDNLVAHGLDKPTLKVTLKSQDKSATVNFGSTTIGGDRAVMFVTTGVAPRRPLAVRRADFSALFRDGSKSDGAAWVTAKWITDYRAKRLLGANAMDPTSEVAALKITTGGKELALTKSPSGTWTFTAPPGYGEADDAGSSGPTATTGAFTGVNPLLAALTGLQAMSNDDFLENQKPEDFAKYGLVANDPKVIRVELQLKGAPAPEVLFIGKPVEENGKPVVPSKVYCRIDGDSAVVKVATDRVESLRQTAVDPREMRNRDVLPPSKRDEINAIDLTVGSAVVKLRKFADPAPAATGAPGARWVLFGGPGDPTDAKRSEVEALLTVLTRPRAAEDVLTAPDNAAFAAPETKAVVKVWYGPAEQPAKVEPGKPQPEPKVKDPATELTFGRTDALAVFVRRTGAGAPADLKLSLATLAQVQKSRLVFLDPKLKSFNAGTVVRLAFNRGAEQYDMTRNETTGLWTFAKPDGRKGKTADSEKATVLLSTLTLMSPDRLVAENPTPDELKKWGLDPAAPHTKITVGLNDPADKERVYELGAETEDKKSVYARQDGRPFVFLANTAAAEKFAKEDLRDMTIFRVDPAKVTKIKLRGWRGLLGGPNPHEYQFEKKGTAWAPVAPTPAEFAVDPAKLDQLLTALKTPRAAAFVNIRLEPQYGLEPAINPDWFEFTIEQDGKPHTLVLGSKSDGPNVYGMSSGVPGEVFTIDATAIRALTDKPASLQK